MAEICYGAYNDFFIPFVKSYANKNSLAIDTMVFDETRPDLISKNGAKVVIARGLTAKKISEKTNLPVIEIPIFFENIANAIVTASNISDKIALVSYGNLIAHIDELNPLFNIDVVEVIVDNEKQLHESIKELKNQGIEVIVGGKSQVKIAKQEDLKGVLIEFSEQALNHAIKQAITLLNTLNEENRKKEELNAILNNSSEGFIAVNLNSEITLINRKAASLLAVDKNFLLTKKIGRIFPEFEQIHRILENGESLNEIVIELRGVTVVYNMIPLKLDQEVIGATVHFREINEATIDRLNTRKKILKQGFFARYNFDHIFGNSTQIKEVKTIAGKYAVTESNVLILGETGVGKELFAQSMHNSSKRKNEPFIAINCSTLPENILESELFGYEKGTFTGASQNGKPGLFELADKGTLFLDEITEMSYSFQARLLRVLQEKQILRLGGSRLIPVDVRVFAATNIELSRIRADKHIRPDLFYRLNVLTLNIPPLRERRCDIRQLVSALYPNLYDRFSKESFQPILDYQWPGNVRQLINFLEKISVLSDSKNFNKAWITDMLFSLEGNTNKTITKRSPSKEEIIEALESTGHHYLNASSKLGIHRSTLWRLIKKFDI